MVSWLTDLVKTYLEKLIDGAIAETRYVCCFTSIAEEFKEEHARLEAERRTVEQRVNVATGRGNDILFKVGAWEKKADQLLQEDIKTKKKCFFGFCPDCIWRYKRGKELADKIVTMKQLVDKGEKFENIEIPRRLPDVEFHSSQSYIHFKGRESEYKELLEALKDENNFTTGLHGMGGSGKTTLAIKVGKELKQSENFAHVIDVTVSYTPNIKKIQDDIAGPLGLEWKDCNESDRPKKLWSRLTNGEKILLILDDVWGDQKPPLDFDAIGIPKQDNHKGCRILVTTRNKRVLKEMGCHKIIKLAVLSEEDSRIMFESYAGITNNSPKSLIDKGREIADECKSLPIAIAVVASSLKGQESIEEWDLALKSLQNPLSFIQSNDDIQSDDENLVEIYNCLKFSYDYLKDEKVKRLFLLCSVFPEDKEIDAEILTRLGIGVGLFGEDYDSYNDGRSQVVRAKNKLLDFCLLLEAGKGRVKMHDLIREVAQWIANKEIRTGNMSHKDSNYNNTKYLFWEGNAREMFSSGFVGSNLEILIAVFDTVEDRKVPNSFFENMAGLRVLNLEQKNYYHTRLAFTSQPSIQSWMNIRSLLFSSVDLGDISVLVNLQSLETLDLDSCDITELPHEITKLKKFKLLKLRRCKIRTNNPFEVIEKCSFLEELYFQFSFNKFCKGIDFSLKLQRYVVGTRWVDVELDVSVSKTVVLVGDKNLDIFSEATLKYFFQTTEYLELESIKWQWRNLIPEIVPVDQGMNDLVHLDLSNSSELQYLIKVVGSQVPNVFSKLVVLKLHGMEKLEKLCNGPLSSDSLKALEELSISKCRNLQSLFKFNLDLSSLKKMTLKDCPLLVSIFQLSTAKSLIMLEELEVHNCGKLESIIADEKSGEESKEEILVDDGDNEDEKHSSMFSKLKSLYIKNCPQLEVVLPFLSGDFLIPLETISVESCDKLKYIFDQFVELIGSLKELKLHQLPNFIGIFPKSGHLMPLDLCNLKRISLSECPLLVSVFQLSTAKSLIMLEELKIDGCEQLESLIANEKSGEESKDEILVDDGDNQDKKHSSMFSNLKVLNINKCPQLEVVLPFLYGDLPVQLETISIERCDKLKYIFHQFIELDSLKELRLDGLLGIFPELRLIGSQKCCYGLKYKHRLRSTTSTKILLVSKCFSGQPQILCNITTIKLTEVSKIKSVFTLSTARRMLQLKTLTIESCYELKQIIVDTGDDNGGNNSSNVLPRLKELKVGRCKQLRSTTSTKIPLVSKCFSGQPQILCNITTIKLTEVSKIKSVFTLSTARRMLQLETLTIESCYELKHIIVDTGDDNGGNNSSNVFPRLKELSVHRCKQLEYIFGHYVDDHQSHNEIHLHLPELKSLELDYVPSLVAMCPKQYHITFSPLVTLSLIDCSQVVGKSIGDFMSHASSTTIKELSGNLEHFLSLETLVVSNFFEENSKIENVFILNETNGQKLNLMLNHIFLDHQHVMTYIFVGPKSSVTLHNLTKIYIHRCDKLETLFSTCVVRCFPQLRLLDINGCNDLKHIIEEDAEDEMMSNSLPTATGTCFPKFEILKVKNCNKLEFVFPVSICKQLPKLKTLMIREADALQEVFRSKDAQKVEIPNLKVIVFVNLASLSQTQASQFQNVEHRLVENCQKLSLTSVSTLSDDEIRFLDWGVADYIKDRRKETTKDFATGIEVQATSGHELSSSQEFLNEPSTSQQHPVGEADTTAKPSRGNICLEETKDESIQEVLISEKGSTTVMGSFKKSDEQETTLDNVVTVNTSTPVESVSSSSTPLVNFEHKTSLHVKDDEIRVSEPKPSPTTNSSLASQSISTLYEGNPPQTVENPSSSSLITRELQQLVSKNHLASENLSDYHQLTDLPTGIEVQLSCIISEHELSSLQCLEEIQATSASEKDITTIMSTNSETRSKPPTQSLSPKSKQESFKTSVEEGTMLVNTKTITSSTHSESGSLVTSELKTSSNEAGYGKISITSQTNDQRVKDRNLTAETSKDFSVGVKVQAASGHKLTSSQEFLNEPSTSQQHPVGEADTTAKPSRGNNCLEETKDESIQEVLISEKATTTVMESFKRIDQQGTTLDNVNTVATSTPIESVSSEHKTSLHVKDDEISVSEPKPSPTTSFVASQSISTPYEGNPPQTVENPSTSSLIIRELQQLVSKNHLASENLSLLTDFLVKHPSVHLKDAYKVGNKYKGYAYNCLAELLIFLQTRSILDVVGSSRSKFVELLQEARSFDFDKDWLDGVEKRVLFPDLHLSQDALEKLFHSKQQVTKEIEMLRLKIGIFTQHVEELKHQLASSEAVLENISQQEAQVLESRAALSAPLGY